MDIKLILLLVALSKTGLDDDYARMPQTLCGSHTILGTDGKGGLRLPSKTCVRNSLTASGYRSLPFNLCQFSQSKQNTSPTGSLLTSS